VGGGQRDVLESLMRQREVMEKLVGSGLLAASKERRKPREFRAQCDEYLNEITVAYRQSGHHLAALKGLGAVELRVRNPSPRNLRGVEVELLLPAGVVASRGRPDKPSHKPKAPLAWGRDTVMESIVSPISVSASHIPGLVSAMPPSVWHLRSGDGLVFEAFDLRPYKDHVLPSVHLFCTSSTTDTAVDLRWRATAQNTDNRAEGLLTFGVADSVVTLKNLLEDSRKS
jgi:hypothetical protein